MLLPLLASACLVCAQEAAPARPVAPYKPYKLDNKVVEELRLPDLAGKEHALFAESEGKALVLVFWSYRDPVSRSYAKQLTALRDARADKVALYLVNSNADEIAGSGDPLARMREVVKAEGITLPLLIDHDNRLADDFAALANAQAFVIDAQHMLRYVGGIDDDPKGEKRKKELPVQAWFEGALDKALKAEKITDNWTRAAGRPLKRKAKTPPAAEPVPAKQG